MVAINPMKKQKQAMISNQYSELPISLARYTKDSPAKLGIPRLNFFNKMVPKAFDMIAITIKRKLFIS